MQFRLFCLALVLAAGSIHAPAMAQDGAANSAAAFPSTAPSIGASPAINDEKGSSRTDIGIARMLRAGADLSWLLSPETAGIVSYSPEQLAEARSIIGLAKVAKARSLDRSEEAVNARAVLEAIVLAEVERRSLENSIRVTDQDVAERLAARPGRYDEYRLRHIFVAIGPDRNGHMRTETQARARAAELYAQLARGADFAKLAEMESDDLETAEDGGALSSMFGVYMAPEFFPAVHVLKTGEVGRPVRGASGYHIICLDERIVATIATARYLVTTDIRAEKLPALIKEAIGGSAG